MGPGVQPQAVRRRLAVPAVAREVRRAGPDPVDQMLIREEFAYRRVPMCNANGLDMLSPILLKYGTDEQKDRAPGQDRPHGGDVVPGLLRAGGRLGPDPSEDHGHPRRRGVRRQRQQDLDRPRRARRLDDPAVPHRPRAEGQQGAEPADGRPDEHAGGGHLSDPVHDGSR